MRKKTKTLRWTFFVGPCFFHIDRSRARNISLIDFPPPCFCFFFFFSLCARILAMRHSRRSLTQLCYDIPTSPVVKSRASAVLETSGTKLQNKKTIKITKQWSSFRFGALSRSKCATVSSDSATCRWGNSTRDICVISATSFFRRCFLMRYRRIFVPYSYGASPSLSLVFFFVSRFRSFIFFLRKNYDSSD